MLEITKWLLALRPCYYWEIQYNLCKELPTSSNGMEMAPPDCSAMTHWAVRQHATTQAASEIFLLPLYIVVYHHKLMFV